MPCARARLSTARAAAPAASKRQPQPRSAPGIGGTIASDASYAKPVGSLWKSIGFTSGARIYSVCAGAIGLVITARALGPSGRGVVATAVTWSLLFSTVGYLSLGQVALHRGTERDPREWLGPSLASLLAMTAVVSVAGWILAAVIYAVSDGSAYGHIPVYALALGFLTLPFLVWEQYGSLLLMALGRVNVYNRAEIAGRTAGIALIVVLVAIAGAGIPGALAALLVAQLIVAAGGIRYLVTRAGATLAFSRDTMRELLAGGAKLHLSSVGTFLFTSASVLIVQSVRGSAETGAFQVVAQLMNVALIVPQAGAMVLYGEVARDGPDRAWAASRRIIVRLVPLMAVAAVVGTIAAPTLIPFVLGDQFSSAVPVFQLLAFALVGQSFSALMAPQWIGRGLFVLASLLTIATGICNVAASFPLVHAYGMKGAAYSLLGVSVVSVIGNGIFALWVQRRAGRSAHAAMAR
jgi:O-antigen/teichoic acid export membrane protein